MFWREKEVELTIDSLFLMPMIVFSAISKCTKSQIVTIEHFYQKITLRW